MNRHQRRADQAKDRGAKLRHAAVQDALTYMAASDDPTISGATVMLPDGQMLYLSADTARAMAPKRSSSGGGRA